VWREGFYREEGEQGESWRWARARASLALVNRSSQPQDVRLRMLVTPNVGGSTLVRSPLLPEPIRVERHNPLVDQRILLPPGRYDVHFESDAPRMAPPNDFREVVFEVRGLEVRRVAESGLPNPSLASGPRPAGGASGVIAFADGRADQDERAGTWWESSALSASP
jgi:hypothetical protein